jgi:nucleotide-binding universal stress UspA family protein
MKILIAADGSEYTRQMLAYLAAHSDFLGNSHDYTVLTVSPPVPPRATAMLDKEMLENYYRDESDEVFKPIKAFFDQKGMKAQFRTEVGHAAETIARIAEDEKFDLLVMGSHGHSPLGSLVMGSVTNRVLAHCKTPVLLIR